MTTTSPFIAINWGSTNFRAQLLSHAGVVLDTFQSNNGITKLDRDGMISTFLEAVEQWTDADNIYASGMIGSPVGWANAPYCHCPTAIDQLAKNLTKTSIGSRRCYIVPGLQSLTPTGTPDVMRGEEIELFGLLLEYPELTSGSQMLALPGTHTKWIHLKDGVIQTFFTSMSGELFDRLQEKGLLSSIMTTSSSYGPAFLEGIEKGRDTHGLSRLLFSVRANVVTGKMDQEDASSYARGLLIGSDISDAAELFPRLKTQDQTFLLGNDGMCKLYNETFKVFNLPPAKIAPHTATSKGFTALHRAILELNE